jgi:hypothetical protein
MRSRRRGVQRQRSGLIAEFEVVAEWNLKLRLVR